MCVDDACAWSRALALVWQASAMLRRHSLIPLAAFLPAAVVSAGPFSVRVCLSVYLSRLACLRDHRSFAAQDVLVPWHLADHHTRKPDIRREDLTITTTTTNTNSMVAGDGGVDNTNDSKPDRPAAQDAGGSGDGAPASTESVEAAGSTSFAPTPAAPRHGVRVDAAAGSGGGSVVYQRYCHVYAEGELEALVQRVDGLRLIESYYDRSNWCVVAEREG